MKESNAFHWRRKKRPESPDEQERMRKEMYGAKEGLREERKIYKEEEDEMCKMGEDVDRLRRERNEWRDYYDELTRLGHEEFDHKEFAHETRSESSAATGTVVDPFKSKISRKPRIGQGSTNWSFGSQKLLTRWRSRNWWPLICIVKRAKKILTSRKRTKTSLIWWANILGWDVKKRTSKQRQLPSRYKSLPATTETDSTKPAKLLLRRRRMIR